ncbi:MAG TPA: bifunctional diaminohydroxyphosphoribosylaminopyrimidine deaminase/5-amino-6-(5-phosphoribosylamino)uracil reductase RibD [Nitrospiria bacterium]|nr:bifunctional diaminohydroxyphosphoribosylaminopyrimidine deaminase/5-amino-6-(5-phosphoribosylamino)uracil reductase RibD [Nitrospiria bacterium]
MMTDEDYMSMALSLAKKGKGKTSPNPMVGAIVVRDRKVIGRGFHERPGLPHAEVLAMAAAGSGVRGATLYTNLEPCVHTKKRTPPCTGEIIRRGIKRVVIGMIDPNPMVSGRGIEELKKGGVSVVAGILKEKAERLNEAFSKYITRRRPFVILKIASSLDGKIATPAGESKWITGDISRRYVHRLRSEADAVMVGIGTILKDDPSLTSRVKDGRDPIRIVVDERLCIPTGSKVLSLDSPSKTYIATIYGASKAKIRKIEEMGGLVLTVKKKDGLVDLTSLMDRLGEMEITSLLIEGGAEINASALAEGIVDKAIFFFAPKIIGGQRSLSSIGGDSPENLEELTHVHDIRIKKMGADIMVEGYVTLDKREAAYARKGILRRTG